MAATFILFNDSKMNLGKAMNLATNTFKMTLHTDSWTPDIDNDTTTADVTDELAASGNYMTGGKTLANNVFVADDTNDRAYFDFDDVIWTALTPSGNLRYAIINSVTDSSNLLGYIDFGATQDPGGSNFTVQPTAPGSGGLFYI